MLKLILLPFFKFLKATKTVKNMASIIVALYMRSASRACAATFPTLVNLRQPFSKYITGLHCVSSK